MKAGSIRVIFAAGLLLLAACDRRRADVSDSTAGSLTSATATELVPLTNMVRIPAGEFIRMKHRVTLTRDFWLGKYEVTQAEYSALMGSNPSHFKDRPDCPVEKLSHKDAMAYCAKLTARERAAGHLPAGYSYRLPTEAEWEYACRAGSTNRYSFGDQQAEAGGYAWTAENSGGAPHPVGQKKPNSFGLYDMHGNVWEWVADWFESYPAADTIDPTGPSGGKFRIFRGGGWDKDVDFARCGNRFMMGPETGIYFVGFRVALGRGSL